MKGTRSKLFQQLNLIQKMHCGYIPDNAFIDIFGSDPEQILDMDRKRGYKYYPGNMCRNCLNRQNGNCKRYCKIFKRKFSFSMVSAGSFLGNVLICKNFINRKKYWDKIKRNEENSSKTIDKAEKV